MNNKKWFFAYKNKNDGFVYAFNSYASALEHATKEGEFNEKCERGKLIKNEKNLFFAIREEKLIKIEKHEIVKKFY